MNNSCKQIIENCINNFLKLPQLYDILLRGSAIYDSNLIDGWSDLDFTIIFFKIDPKILKQLNFIYQSLKTKYSFKISITIVTKKDFMSPIHNHGIKPLHYNAILENSISVLKRKFPKWNNDILH